MSKITHDYCHPDGAAFANENNRGLTKREYFAAMALQGLMGRRWERPGVSDDEIITTWGKSAVACADALIDALNKPVQP